MEFQIKTKYNIGDTVYVKRRDSLDKTFLRIEKIEIKSICVNINGIDDYFFVDSEIYYYDGYNAAYPCKLGFKESDITLTYSECIQELKKDIDQFFNDQVSNLEKNGYVNIKLRK